MTPSGPSFTTAISTPAAQPVRLFVRGAFADSDGAFLVVADRDGDVRQDPGDLFPGFGFGGPEHRPVVEVQDCELAGLQPGAGTRLMGLDMGGAAGLLQRPVTVDQKIPASLMAARSSSSALICRSGAVGNRP